MKQAVHRICFLADKHGLFDDRIYWKMAVPLKKLGWDVHYYLIGEESDQGTTEEGIHFIVLKVKTFSSNRYINFLLKRSNPFNNYKTLFQKAASLKADIYHFHDLWINRIGVKLKQLPHHPVVFYDAREPYADDYRSYLAGGAVKNYLIGLFSKAIDTWEKSKARHYDLIISNEEGVRDEFRKVLGEKKAIVLYNYVDADLLKPPSSPIAKKFDFIYCGGINEYRGIDVCIKAFERVLQKFPQSTMLVIGKYFPSDYKEQLKLMIESLDLEGQVELHDPVSHVNLAEYYAKSRIGLCVLSPITTFERSLPIKLFEYMAFGLPIVGTGIGHIKKYLTENNTGLTVDYFNLDQITHAMTRLLEDRKLYDQLSENGIKITRERYNWQGEFDKLIAHYRDSIRSRTHSE